MDDKINHPQEQGLREAVDALEMLLACPEIADCDPRDKDEETHTAERKARAAVRSIVALLALSDKPETTEPAELTCRYCGRNDKRCMNTRDMDPIDGFNNDPICNRALHDAGGGERGFKMNEPAAMPEPEEEAVGWRVNVLGCGYMWFDVREDAIQAANGHNELIEPLYAAPFKSIQEKDDVGKA